MTGVIINGGALNGERNIQHVQEMLQTVTKYRTNYPCDSYTKLDGYTIKCNKFQISLTYPPTNERGKRWQETFSNAQSADLGAYIAHSCKLSRILKLENLRKKDASLE